MFTTLARFVDYSFKYALLLRLRRFLSVSRRIQVLRFYPWFGPAFSVVSFCVLWSFIAFGL